MNIGGFTKFLREVGLIAMDTNEKIVNYKLEFPFNLTLSTKAKFSNTMKAGNYNNTLNNLPYFNNVINFSQILLKDNFIIYILIKIYFQGRESTKPNKPTKPKKYS